MISKQVTWTLGNGKQATVTVELATSQIADADGYKVEVSCCDMDIRAEVEGMGRVGTGHPVAAKSDVAVAKIGKLGLTAETLALVNAAIAEVEASPEWQAHLADIARSDADDAAYEAHSRMMARAMGGSRV